VYTLRRLLSPNYAVIPIAESALLKEPWAPTCALLVFPGGADLGYCRVLNGEGNRRIDAYVRRGGGYLGFCAGGYYGSRRCEFEVGNPALEVIGSRELKFFPGTCRGGAFKGFAYHSESGARAVRLKVRKDVFGEADGLPDEVISYYNGGGVFVDAEKMGSDGVEVLATYEDELDVDASSGRAALVFCKVGNGAALLTGPHPESVLPSLIKSGADQKQICGCKSSQPAGSTEVRRAHQDAGSPRPKSDGISQRMSLQARPAGESGSGRNTGDI
jgi:biotin---protein ligase